MGRLAQVASQQILQHTRKADLALFMDMGLLYLNPKGIMGHRETPELFSNGDIGLSDAYHLEFIDNVSSIPLKGLRSPQQGTPHSPSREASFPLAILPPDFPTGNNGYNGPSTSVVSR